ncbi:MAG: hypothetical protein WDO73_26825 [Ignavibacteriota bacterium]
MVTNSAGPRQSHGQIAETIRAGRSRARELSEPDGAPGGDDSTSAQQDDIEIMAYRGVAEYSGHRDR